MRWAEHVARTLGNKNVCRILFEMETFGGMKGFGKPAHGWKENVEGKLEGTEWNLTGSP
jgi:hypothetical protein